MANKGLSVSEICQILTKCNELGVKKFALGDLHFKFHTRRNEYADKLGPASDIKVDGATQVESKLSESDRDQAQMFDEQNMLEAEEAQLLIDDPSAFEKVQMDRHLERARNEKT